MDVYRKKGFEYMEKKLFIFLMVGIVIFSGNAIATWQDDLEDSGFDIVETFDEYQDWVGQDNIDGCTNLESNCDLPVLIDGSNGLWDMYEDFSSTYGCSGPKAGEYWISYHGQGNSWSGTKSLSMSYSDPLVNPNNHYDYRIDFNSGGPYQPQIGDSIIGEQSGATAIITGIIRYIDTGSWAGGDTLGEFYITDKSGNFIDGENVNINSTPNAATL